VKVVPRAAQDEIVRVEVTGLDRAEIDRRLAAYLSTAVA
jgi:hypothetical protein